MQDFCATDKSLNSQVYLKYKETEIELEMHMNKLYSFSWK